MRFEDIWVVFWLLPYYKELKLTRKQLILQVIHYMAF